MSGVWCVVQWSNQARHCDHKRDKLKRAGQCLANIFASKIGFKDLNPTKPVNLSELRR